MRNRNGVGMSVKLGLSRSSVRGALRIPTRWYLILLLAMVLAVPALPQHKPAALTERSIEDLMNIEVTSVSKKEEKLSRTAAAIFVITTEDIRRSGAANIPDLL